MKFENQNTSLITILSSEHGRLRREQRDIDKRDLQRALRYGTKHPAWGKRWMVEYDGITFVTDRTMREEITAYPSPLPKLPIDYSMELEQQKTKMLLKKKPELSTSHTVIVIDNSGSMLAKKNDVHLYRDSQNAAFSLTALEFVAEQLFNRTAVNSDLVSLVKFNRAADVPFEREPIAWPVYNELLSHRNVERFVHRVHSPLRDEQEAGSNYLPALAKAHELLEAGVHDKCALSLFFFSDGTPTDHTHLGISSKAAQERICEAMSCMATRFGDSLNVTIVGLGNRGDQFMTLQAMADAAIKAGAKGTFEFCNKTANALSSAISSLVSSTTETRTALLEGRSKVLTTRADLKSEKEAVAKFDWQYFSILEHLIYDTRSKQFASRGSLPRAAVQSDPEEAALRSFHPPPYLAINRNFVGKGAERVAFRCRLSDSKGVNGFVFDTMIAKETKDVERIEENVEFHTDFMETQELASYLADEFNKQLCALPDFDPQITPQIKFLSCSILLVSDPNWPRECRGVLVEKMLDTERFRWTKWNDNNGMVDGMHSHAPLNVDFELKQLAKEQKADLLGAILEEGDSDDDASVSDVESDEDEVNDISTRIVKEINPSDYLQAFTHFTYRHTHKRVLVCDLQSVFNTDLTPPTFELTDPAIHYASTNGRRMVFGRTDKGKSGMKNFFSTHKCTGICKFLEPSARNKKWRRDWHRNSGHSEAARDEQRKVKKEDSSKNRITRSSGPCMLDMRQYDSSVIQSIYEDNRLEQIFRWLWRNMKDYGEPR